MSLAVFVCACVVDAITLAAADAFAIAPNATTAVAAGNSQSVEGATA